MTGVLIILLICLGLGAWFLVPFVVRRIGEERLARRCREEKAIVLSYDDGPGPELTPRLIRLLAEYDAKATFFILGRNVEAARDVVDLLATAGHEIGSHTYDHTNAWKAGPLRAARDLARGIEMTTRAGGEGRFFRPPFGKLTLAGLLDGFRRGLRYGWWTIDSRDSWDRRTIQDVLSEVETQQGGVVLMHDFDTYDKGTPAAGVSHADHVLALTGSLLEFAREHGYRVVPLGALQDAAVSQ